MTSTVRKEKRRLIENILSLSVLQGANYLLPLLTLPFLARVLGPEKFGLLAFATATNTYFSIIIDYGFNLSATQQISQHRSEPDRLSEIYSSVLTLKLTLVSLCLIALIILVNTITAFKDEQALFILSFGTAIGQALFPTWFFQGMERMRSTALLNILAKTASVLAIFVFIRSEADYLDVAIFNSLASISVGLIAMGTIRYKFDIRLRLERFENLKAQLLEGWHVFLSTLSISLYTVSITLFLGIYTNSTIVGHFSAAEKIIKAIQGLYSPLSQAIYPYINKKIRSDQTAGLAIARKLLIVVSIPMLLLSSSIFFLADIIIIKIFGVNYDSSILPLKIMAFLPFIIVISNILGVQIMLNVGKKLQFSRILRTAAILGIALSYALIHLYDALGAAITALLVEIFVTLTMIIYISKSDIEFFKFSR